MILANLNEARHAAMGNYRAPCPECDRGATDDALGVTVEPGGHYVWYCFRCDWAGASGVTTSIAQPRAKDAPEAHPKGLANGRQTYGNPRASSKATPWHTFRHVRVFARHGRRFALPPSTKA